MVYNYNHSFSATDMWSACCQLEVLSCSPAPFGITNCKKLISIHFLHWLIWIFGFISMLGNLAAILGCLAHFRTKEEQCLLNIMLLQFLISSVMTGLFMVVIAAVAVSHQVKR